MNTTCHILGVKSTADHKDFTVHYLQLKAGLSEICIFSSEPGPAATMVGNIVMGTRIGGAAGREIADIEEDSDMARKVT